MEGEPEMDRYSDLFYKIVMGGVTGPLSTVFPTRSIFLIFSSAVWWQGSLRGSFWAGNSEKNGTSKGGEWLGHGLATCYY